MKKHESICKRKKITCEFRMMESLEKEYGHSKLNNGDIEIWIAWNGHSKLKQTSFASIFDTVIEPKHLAASRRWWSGGAEGLGWMMLVDLWIVGGQEVVLGFGGISGCRCCGRVREKYDFTWTTGYGWRSWLLPPGWGESRGGGGRRVGVAVGLVFALFLFLFLLNMLTYRMCSTGYLPVKCFKIRHSLKLILS